MRGRVTGARVVGSAVGQYLDQLSQGDPWAIGFTVFAAVLLLGVGAIVVIDRRSQAKEARKSAGRPAAGRKPGRYDR